MKKYMIQLMFLLGWISQGGTITITLKPYVILSGDVLSLQDMIEEKLETNFILEEKKTRYTALEVGKLLQRFGLRDVGVIGKEVVIFRRVRLLTPEEWYKQIQETFPPMMLESVALPERFEVVSEERRQDGVVLTCRVYQPTSWIITQFSIPFRVSAERKENVSPYGFEWTGEREGFLTYRGKGVRIRIPVKLVSSPQSEIILVENKINHRILRLKRQEIEGL
ncbi:MAG: hypothetical protein N2314_02060 [Brevinematales bacterium]|nr:hypothetical protein [Brevinematales bacterium]